MRKAKRTLPLLLAFIMTMSAVVSGCSTGTQANQTKGKPYEIDWYLWNPNGAQTDESQIQTEINKIIKPKLNETVNIHILDPYDTKMQSLVATGAKIDLVWTSSWLYPYSQNAAKGAFVDITKLLPKDAPDAYKVLSNGWLDAAKINGKVYGMACNKEKGMGLGLFADKAVAQKEGVDLSTVHSLADLEPIFKKIKADLPNEVPFALANQRDFATLDSAFACTYGINPIIMKADGSGFYDELDDPQFVADCNIMAGYYKAGYINKDCYTIQDVSSLHKTNGFLWTSSYKPYVDIQVAQETGKDIVAVQMGQPIARTSDMTGYMMAVGSTSQNPDAVLKFYNLFYSDPKLVNLMVNGILNTHYVMTGSNSIDFAPSTNGGKSSGYNPQNSWMIGNQFLDYIVKGQPADVWKQYQDFNDSCKLGPALGFTPDLTSVQTQVAAMSNVNQQYLCPLISGVSDAAKIIPEYKAKLNQNGMQTVIDTINKQYADWKKATGK